ncbi:hypothetical protein IC229_01210 [Spirosoma sp. BT702]|uniref:Uncharacterized protein n=1 Tax=Spirosoma profusum TaxID=2771354 RepID=A0A926XT95_9BACT|nr:hypothetical protein [Spirosoma profusum]MBD2699234.1 hypothetical protein [Spirosoma profusum]
MLISIPDILIEGTSLIIPSYPFKPSIACRQDRFIATDVMNIDVSAAPPAIRVNNELIFISAKHKDDLVLFAEANQIPIVRRDDVWDGLLEPFLDTEYTDVTHQRIVSWLATYGLTEEIITSIRDEVGKQLYAYNFGTMLWEWVHLGAFDVLCAMRSTYSAEQFADFYRKVMDIALLPDK